MSHKRLVIHVRGKQKAWSFEFVGDPRYIEEWRTDGLDVFEVVNSIPEWIVDIGLTRPWCFVQDVINFKNPWSKK